MAEAAGWYADPSGKVDTYRWWNGGAWTRWLSADPAAGDPGPSPAINPPPSTEPAPAPTAYAAPDPADRVVRLPAAAAIILGGVLLAVIAVGVIISLTADRPLTGPAVAPPPPTEAPLVVTYDATSRAASVEELRVVLPGTPFSCDDQPGEVPGLSPSAVTCRALVHQDYDGKGSSWAAATGIALLEEDQTETDLRQLLATTASNLIRRDYDADDIEIKKAGNRPFPDVAPEGRARIVRAELHLSYRGLPTAYDTIRVALFHLESGRYAAWWAFLPNDSPPATADALEGSAASVSARK